MNKDLEAKEKVILNFLATHAEVDEIQITDSSFIVRRRTRYETQANQTGSTQIVNVHANASASSSANITAQFSVLRKELKDIYKGDVRLNDLEEKIGKIEVELNKKAPDKLTLKKLLHWISDFDWNTYLKILPIILGKFS